jgi:hypothetical protein
VISAPWLTTDDLAALFQFRDRRAAVTLARRLGGVKVGGRWRVPPDAVDRLRINARAEADHAARDALREQARGGLDPVAHVPATLPRGWSD